MRERVQESSVERDGILAKAEELGRFVDLDDGFPFCFQKFEEFGDGRYLLLKL